MHAKFLRCCRLPIIGLWLLSELGCAGTDGQGGQVTYYDRNHDGKVDLEKHHYPHTADEDWQLRDDNFDGSYEEKVIMGFGILRSPVDIPVPTDVRIEKPKA